MSMIAMLIFSWKTEISLTVFETVSKKRKSTAMKLMHNNFEQKGTSHCILI